MLSYEYIQFLNEHVLNHLPSQHWRIGDKINFKCPVCGDGKSGRKHRAWYYLKSASFYCFNCSTGMSGIKFLEFISGNNYEQIKKEYMKMYFKSGLNSSLSSQYEIPDEEPTVFQLQSIVKPEWKQPLSEKAKQYLDNRKVTDAPFRKENLYCCTTKTNEEYIMIPWRLNGIDAYYQLNDYQKLHSMKYIFPKDKKKLLYGLDNIDISWPYIIIFEGVFNSLFVKNGIASGTKAITEYQLKLIKERFPRHQIVVSFDNDKPGIESMVRLLKENNNFKYFIWWTSEIMKTCKDINEFILQQDNPNFFIDKNKIENMIYSPLQAKMFLLKNRLWSNF